MSYLIERSGGNLTQLHKLYTQMGKDEHVRGDSKGVFAQSGQGQVKSNPNWFHKDELNEARQYARGYDGVKQMIARSVGEHQAERIMGKVMDGKSHRGWTKCWMPRRTAMTKQQLKQIIAKTYQTLARQLARHDVHQRQGWLLKMYPQAEKLQDIHDPPRDSANKGEPKRLADALRDPELRSLICAQAAMDLEGDNMELLNDMEHYDALVEGAKSHMRYMESEGLLDYNGNPNKKAQGKTKLLKQHQDYLDEVRNKASEIYQKYIDPQGSHPLGLLTHRKLNPVFIKQANYRQLKGLFGDADQGVRAEILHRVEKTYKRLRERLKATTLTVNIRGLIDRRYYNVTRQSLQRLHDQMKPGDHLRMKRGTETILYCKPDKDSDSEPHNVAEWYQTVGNLFAINTRHTKFINAKRAVRDALHFHFSKYREPEDKRLANKLMKRVTSSGKGMSKAELAAVLDLMKAKTAIDTDLKLLKNENRRGEITLMTGRQVLDAWLAKKDDKIARLLSNHAKIYRPNVKPRAIAFAKLARKLGGLSENAPLNLKSAQKDARRILKSSMGLSSRARADLKRFIKLSCDNFGDKKDLLKTLSCELERCAEKLADNTLVSFRSNSKFCPYTPWGLKDALSKLSKEEFDQISPATLRANPNSNAAMVFRVCWPESKKVQLAGFSHYLSTTLNGWRLNTSLSIYQKKEIQSKAKSLLDQLGWPPESVGLLVVVTQTGDYILPSTACLLQQRLGLGRSTAAF
ncbi:MAG: hypothetical protein MI861_01415, partial [Pirellulales bacterium]|nr:hypothetical protein [Pirellulales bacterium]